MYNIRNVIRVNYLKAFIDFQSFIQECAYKSSDFRLTYTPSMNYEGAITVELGKSEESKIFEIFNEQIVLLREALRKSPDLRLKLYSLERSLSQALQINLSPLFKSCILARVQASDSKDPVESFFLDDVRYSQLLQVNFEAYVEAQSETFELPFTSEQIHHYLRISRNRETLFSNLNLTSISSDEIEGYLAAIEVADYLSDLSLVESLVYKVTSFPSLSELELLDLYTFLNTIPSCYSQRNIRTMAARNLNVYLHKKPREMLLQFFQQLSNRLGPKFVENIKILNLSSCNVDNNLFRELSIILPYVEELIIRKFPEEKLDLKTGCGDTGWRGSLRVLDVSNPTVKEIQGLNDLASLEEINISGTNITAAPTGCFNLKVFRAEGSKGLSDISGLNDLKHLKHLSLSNTLVTAAPTGCTTLEVFSADSAERLSDISALNISPNL